MPHQFNVNLRWSVCSCVWLHYIEAVRLLIKMLFCAFLPIKDDNDVGDTHLSPPLEKEDECSSSFEKVFLLFLIT